MKRVARVAIVCLAVVAGACGSSDGETSAGTPSTVAGAATGGAMTTRRQSILDDLRSSYASPGAIAAVERDGTRWFGSSGDADLVNTKITKDTRFRIASVTKALVAAVVLDAVATGALALDDRVATLAPGLVSISDAITMRMLLSHTSGLFAEGDEGDIAADIGNLTDPVRRAEANELASKFLTGQPVSPSVGLLVALAETHGLYAAPGTGYHYSNINYLVAGAVLESVTARPLADLFRDRVVEPLALQRTTLAPDDATAPEFVGYARGADGKLTDPGNAYLLLLGNGAAGGVISTADELLTVMQAIVAGRIAGREMTREMLTPSAPSGPAAYGLGIATYSFTCGTFLGHEGAIDGTSVLAVVSRSGADGVVLALNARSDRDPGLPAAADRILCGDQ